jgi:N-formylglutamate amidohydrolase
MLQTREDGTQKLNEPYTKAISLYLNKYSNVYSIVKNNDTGIDSNRDNYDKYNVELRRLIKDNNIKLVIDIHGASSDRDFDIEFGTLNNLSADYSTIKELEEAFTENGITNVIHNEPFKGGAITQGVYALTDVDVIQLEINGKYRDYNNLELLHKLINSLDKFIKQYNTYINK